MKYDIAIIGGGPAGYVGAIKAAQLGLKTVCIEKRGKLGGTCLNVGCIPSKALLHNSHFFHQIQHEAKNRGVNLPGEVSVNLNQMMAAKDKSVSQLTGGIEMLLKKNKVDYIKGTGKLIGDSKISINTLDNETQTVTATRIVIATGSEVSPFPGIDVDEKVIVSSTGALALDKVPKKMIVIGGGVIGLELGSVWSRLGAEVTVVEFMDSVGGLGIDSEISKATLGFLKKQGLKFKLGTKVTSATINGDGVTATVKVMPAKGDNSVEEIFEDIDCVLVSVGRRPYTQGLGLEDIGVKMDNRGRILVNSLFETNIANVHAVGDVIPGPMLAHKAEDEAVACMENFCAEHPPTAGIYHPHAAIPSVIYTNPEVAWVGKTEDELKSEKVNYAIGKFSFAANSRAKTVDEPTGLVKILTCKDTDKLLGAHIVGSHAGELIHTQVMALEFGASAEDIARTCHAHPTFSEAVKEAATAAYFGKPINS